MGNWYTNINLKNVDPLDVVEQLRALGRRGIVTPAQNGWVTAYDEECDKFDLDVLESLTLTLTTTLGCIGVPCFNVDDDVLWLAVYDRGKMTSRYASAKQMFEDANEFPIVEEFAADLCRVFERPERVQSVRRILGRGHGMLGLLRFLKLSLAYVVEIERHADLKHAVDLPPASVGLGYTYVGRGELAEGMDVAELLRT